MSDWSNWLILGLIAANALWFARDRLKANWLLALQKECEGLKDRDSDRKEEIKNLRSDLNRELEARDKIIHKLIDLEKTRR